MILKDWMHPYYGLCSRQCVQELVEMCGGRKQAVIEPRDPGDFQADVEDAASKQPKEPASNLLMDAEVLELFEP